MHRRFELDDEWSVRDICKLGWQPLLSDCKYILHNMYIYIYISCSQKHSEFAGLQKTLIYRTAPHWPPVYDFCCLRIELFGHGHYIPYKCCMALAYVVHMCMDHAWSAGLIDVSCLRWCIYVHIMDIICARIEQQGVRQSCASLAHSTEINARYVFNMLEQEDVRFD